MSAVRRGGEWGGLLLLGGLSQEGGLAGVAPHHPRPAPRRHRRLLHRLQPRARSRRAQVSPLGDGGTGRAGEARLGTRLPSFLRPFGTEHMG